MLMKAWCNEREEGGGREGKYSKKVRVMIEREMSSELKHRLQRSLMRDALFQVKFATHLIRPPSREFPLCTGDRVSTHQPRESNDWRRYSPHQPLRWPASKMSSPAIRVTKGE